MLVIDSNAVRSLMIEQQVTATDLANRVDGLSKVTVANLARRDTRSTTATIGRLAQALGVKPETFLKQADEKSRVHRELEQLVAMRAEFADRYPTDKARLETLDEMIQESRAELEGGNHDVHCS